MAVLQHYYSEEVRTFLRANGRSVTRYDISELFGTAHVNQQPGENAVNGFRATGIYAVNRRVFRDKHFSPVGEEATVQMESSTENRLQSGDSGSRTQESPSVSGQSSSFCVYPKGILSPPPAAVNVTTKRGMPKGTSNVITSSPFRNNRLLQSKRNGTASRPLFADKGKGSN
jgi:hypothetical protein